MCETGRVATYRGRENGGRVNCRGRQSKYGAQKLSAPLPYASYLWIPERRGQLALDDTPTTGPRSSTTYNVTAASMASSAPSFFLKCIASVPFRRSAANRVRKSVCGLSTRTATSLGTVNSVVPASMGVEVNTSTPPPAAGPQDNPACASTPFSPSLEHNSHTQGEISAAARVKK